MADPPDGLGEDFEAPRRGRRRSAPAIEGDYPPWFWWVVGASGFIVVVLPVLWILGGVGRNAALERSRNEACLYNLQHLWQAASLYAEDNRALPPSGTWTKALTPMLRRKPGGMAILRCPSLDSPYGYAMQAAFSGRALTELNNPGKALVFYDSVTGRPNALDTLGSIPEYGRHFGKSNVAFADGHTAAMTHAETRPFVVPLMHPDQ